MLPAASALLLVLIVLTAYFTAPLYAVVFVLYMHCYQLYADCVHVDTYIRSCVLRKLSQREM
jgi:hypothetical protein